MLDHLRYEARWQDWSREDGSNVTWNNDYIDPEDIRPWTKAQKRRRAELAAESCDIDIWGTTDIVNTATRLRAQAYEEKLENRRRKPLPSLKWEMDRLMASKEAEGEETGPTLRTTPARREQTRRAMSIAESVTSNQSSVTLRSGSVSTIPSTPTVFGTPPHSAKFSDGENASTRKSHAAFYRSREPSSGPSSSSRSQPGRIPRKLSKRDELQRKWTQAAKRSRAASITIANDIDNELLPPLVPNFEYLESEFRYSSRIPVPDDTELFVSCDCDICSSASVCSCQEPSELWNRVGRKSYAYTSEGLFAFNVPTGVEVIECNKFCKCNFKTCPNRVAQRPRDIPIEIFKTVYCGWGVRAPIDIQQGKVLGLYTGELIHRVVADALEGDDRAYIFDLDGQEDPNSETPEGLDAYSVDSRKYGNWTRFLNHSCSPNVQVYLVVYDTIPERNTPYIAFVAICDIPPGTELTFDYNPAAGKTSKKKGKGKGRATIPEGTKPCMCGTAACRGWI
ncbi:hypothetical protein BDZ94DRAFT_1260968 [Collybia nuda]|uniref:Histone-lysine N-methyltransferase n=1 Tax=Collybia nuda TaxID=64659 RepID=A0A9P5Y7B1_9AGAR|nr:hypothetical protein BDZ94DRAFT_1260968 [Collybia nuda]